MTEFPDRNLDVLRQRVASGQKSFVPLREMNANEGETWIWWLQLWGNQEELAKLSEMLKSWRGDDEQDMMHFPYELNLQKIEPESVVDKLVEHGGQGYFNYQNKIVGKFTCPEDLANGADFLYTGADVLYKGGIRSLFT